MPNTQTGDDKDNEFKDTSATDLYYGLGGSDHFEIRMINPGQEPRDEFYGDDGRDHFDLWLRGETFGMIQSGRLEEPLISGGAGGDSLSVWLWRVDEKINFQKLYHHFTSEGIERLEWSANTSADVLGSRHRDNIAWAQMRHQADIYAGAGNDQALVFAQSERVELHGEAGSDILAGVAERASERPTLHGGQGDDYFFGYPLFLGKGWSGATIADFDRKEDHILIQTKFSFESIPYINADDAHRSWKQFRDHVTYDDGEVRINGKLAFIVEGEPDLKFGDFLFI